MRSPLGDKRNAFVESIGRPLCRGVRPTRLACVAVGIGLILGCTSGSVPEADQNETHPAFIAPGPASSCPAGCCRQGEFFARASLGLDPWESGPASSLDAEHLRRTLESMSEETGRELGVIPFAKWLGDVEPGVTSAQILVHKTGHLYVFIGAIDLDGQVACQLIHGNSPVWLVTKRQLKRSGFREVWRSRSPVTSIPAHIGSTSLSLDAVSHNFGEIQPSVDVSCKFRLQNTGNGSIVIDRPITSCRCTAPSIDEKTVLAPGDSEDMEIRIRGSVSASVRHSVALHCFEHGTGVSKMIKLTLLGSQRQSMRVVPNSLDFGTLNAGDRAHRLLTLTEVPSDRFAVVNVHTGELPLAYTQETHVAPDEIATYRFGLELTAAPTDEGEHRGEVVLTTDSRQLPKVVVPVRFAVLPQVRAIPERVSFGMIRIGEHGTRTVHFQARNNEPFSLVVTKAPDSITTSVQNDAPQPTIVVKCRVTQRGIWKGRMEIEAIGSSWRKPLALECVAYGQGDL